MMYKCVKRTRGRVLGEEYIWEMGFGTGGGGTVGLARGTCGARGVRWRDEGEGGRGRLLLQGRKG